MAGALGRGEAHQKQVNSFSKRFVVYMVTIIEKGRRGKKILDP